MPDGAYRTTLRIPGLQAFLWTQFLGAFNDNVFKIIVSFYAMRVLGPERGIPLAATVFVLPFLLFSGWSGHLADAYSKRTVLIWTKSLEILAMGLAVPALMLVESDPSRAVVLQLGVLFLLATHSTFFSPAKYGILPEAVPPSELSRANGLLEMNTFAAIVLGTSVGGELFQRWNDEPWVLGVVLVAIAIIGTAASFGIPRVRAARPGQPFAWNPFGEIGRGLARLWPDQTLSDHDDGHLVLLAAGDASSSRFSCHGARRRSPSARRPPPASTRSSRSASAQAACSPAVSPATRSSSASCRSARSDSASSACCS